MRAVLEFRGAGEVAVLGGALGFEAGLLHPLLHLADLRDVLLLLLPVDLHARGLFAQFGDVALDLVEAFLRGLVMLLGQGLPFDLELDDGAFDLVDLGGHRIDLDAQARGRLVHQVDGLVGKEAIGDVPVRKGGRGHDGSILDAHAVMDFVALLETAQDGDGLFDRRLIGEHGLEAPGQGGVLLDVLLVLRECGGADATELAARERRLEHVGRVHRSFGGARSDDGVELVDEEDDVAVGFGDRLQHRLQAIFELAPILGPRNQSAHVEGVNTAAAQRLGDIARDDALGETLDDGGLAHPRLADQDRVVLGSSREHLDHATDLVRAADDGIQLALEGGVGQVARILLKGLVAVFRVGIVRFLGSADLLQNGSQLFAGHAPALQEVGAASVERAQGEEEMFGGNVLVLELARFFDCGFQKRIDARETSRSCRRSAWANPRECDRHRPPVGRVSTLRRSRADETTPPC